MSHLHSLQDLFVEQLQDIYDAEHQLMEALPSLAEAAFSADLKETFIDHLDETREHTDRLLEVFQIVGVAPQRKHCKAMAGLIAEGEEVLESSGDPDVMDAALIAAAQRIEHYEIAAYGTMKAFAKRLDYADAARLLDKTLGEEGTADKKLTRLAEGGLLQRSINKEAANA